MDNYNYIEKLEQEIENCCDAKLESQLLPALENGLSADDFFIVCNSLFYREYSKDVMNMEIMEDARKKNILQLHLTRSGIYDQLPEGLFYQPGKLKPFSGSAADMAEEYKLNKKKEYAIRRFFMPLENDFFWQRVQLEKEECALLEGLQSGILNDYFTRLWNIDPSIPKSLIIHLILLLPYAHRIAGDLTLTAQCLQKLLQEEVSIKKIPAAITSAHDQMIMLGEQQLGIDMLCGELFYEPYPVIEFSIGPLQNSQIGDYLEGGNKEIFLRTFYDFFVPAEADVVTRIEVQEEKKNMHLKKAGNDELVLGYSTFL
jgi:hypothetical protein